MRHAQTPASIVIFFHLAGWAAALAAPSSAAETVEYARDIQPILSNNCFKCHGPDEATREAGLRLDTAEGAHEDLGGYQAVQPQDIDNSALMERVATDDEDLRMPPIDSGLELSEKQIELLRAWIEQGGSYGEHWAFQAIERPAVPPSASRPTQRHEGEPDAAAHRPQVANGPLDRFIDRRLESLGLMRSPQAERTTLIRRLYLDLLGVLPSPAEIERFENDNSPAAYEQLVDQLLANPHLGEKWGRHWLDQARYADTNGYSIDSPRTMWPYRDWVIEAVNRDLAFDQFTIEQLAGDLLPQPTTSQLVATGFHRNTLINQEGGTDAEQFRNEATVDRVNTTGAVWLGLTVGCAQCHTHKYDPLTHTEYYQLFAFFNQNEDVNSVSPTVAVATPAQRREVEALDQRIAEAQAALDAFDHQRSSEQQATGTSDDRVDWSVVTIESSTSVAGATFEDLEDGSVLVGGANGDADTYTLTFAAPIQQISGLRLETLTHPSLPSGGPGRAGNGNFVLNEIELSVGGRPTTWLHASADHSQQDYDVSFAIDNNPETGWAINGATPLNVQRTAEFALEKLESNQSPSNAGGDATVTLTFGANPAQYNIGRFRISVTDASPAQLGVPDPERAPLLAELERAQNARTELNKSIPQTMVMRDRESPRETHLLIRGDFLRHGEKVRADTPAFLPGRHTDDEPATRLDLAQWLVSGENPLTARVAVNRLWMRLFGQGLVETENDFGFQGTPPTHPELLDWLASEFRDNDWSVKHLLRTIVCSATYRQSSAIRDDTQTLDPLNKWLARQSRIRVDAEIVRDLAQSASGLLDHEIGGPSVYPPQPDGVYAFTQRRASWPTSQGADRHRRGMYTFFMRSAPHPMLTTFDTPAFNTTCTRRVRSNTPLQSLTMANDQAMIEAARGLARRLLQTDPSARLNASKEDTLSRVERAVRFCFSRPPTHEEAERLSDFVAEQRRQFAESPEQAAAVAGIAADDADDLSSQIPDLAATTMLARVLMNLDEFITRE